jgi:hypothetical protein
MSAVHFISSDSIPLGRMVGEPCFLGFQFHAFLSMLDDERLGLGLRLWGKPLDLGPRDVPAFVPPPSLPPRV